MNSYTLGFDEIDKTKLSLVGGQGANPGELSRIEGVRVPVLVGRHSLRTAR